MSKSLKADARQTQLFVGFSNIGIFFVSGFLPLACAVCGGFGGVFLWCISSDHFSSVACGRLGSVNTA